MHAALQLLANWKTELLVDAPYSSTLVVLCNSHPIRQDCLAIHVDTVSSVKASN
jgi:hypothetical protein